MKLKKLTATILEKNKTYGQTEGRPANMRLAQWRVTWLSQIQCFYWAFVQADSLVLLSPPLRQAQNRYRQAWKKLKKFKKNSFDSNLNKKTV